MIGMRETAAEDGGGGALTLGKEAALLAEFVCTGLAAVGGAVFVFDNDCGAEAERAGIVIDCDCESRPRAAGVDSGLCW